MLNKQELCAQLDILGELYEVEWVCSSNPFIYD